MHWFGWFFVLFCSNKALIFFKTIIHLGLKKKFRLNITFWADPRSASIPKIMTKKTVYVLSTFWFLNSSRLQDVWKFHVKNNNQPSVHNASTLKFFSCPIPSTARVHFWLHLLLHFQNPPIFWELCLPHPWLQTQLSLHCYEIFPWGLEKGFSDGVFSLSHLQLGCTASLFKWPVCAWALFASYRLYQRDLHVPYQKILLNVWYVVYALICILLSLTCTCYCTHSWKQPGLVAPMRMLWGW